MRRMLLALAVLLALLPGRCLADPAIENNLLPRSYGEEREHGDGWEPPRAISATELNGDFLVGRWHEVPYLPNGWAGNHNFYKDGSYTYFFENLDLLQSYSGRWAIEDNELVVRLTSGELLYGAELVTDTDTPSDLEGGEWIPFGIDPPTVQRFSLDQLRLHYDNDNETGDPVYEPGYGFAYPILYFGGKPYWKIRSRPEARWIEITRENLTGSWSNDNEMDDGLDARGLAFQNLRADGSCDVCWRDWDVDETGVDLLYQGNWSLDRGTLRLNLTSCVTLTGAALQSGASGYGFAGGKREERMLDPPRVVDYELERMGRYADDGGDDPDAPLRASFLVGDWDLYAGDLVKMEG